MKHLNLRPKIVKQLIGNVGKHLGIGLGNNFIECVPKSIPKKQKWNNEIVLNRKFLLQPGKLSTE